MKKLLYNKHILIRLSFFFIAGFILFAIPKESFAACQLTSGQFRTLSNSISIPQNWFQNSISQNNAQPYVYLDLSFNDDCISDSNQISFSIQEYDTLDPNDLVLGPFTLNITPQSKQQTAYFRAGDSYCDNPASPDCGYFLEMEINDQTFDYSTSQILSLIYDCHQPCDDQAWQYIGTVYSTTTGYQYGSYISPNDPAYIVSQTGGVDNEYDQTGGVDNEYTQVGGVDDVFENLTITEQIENPLGAGGTLPAFIQSLLGIVVRIGIPLVILALVYTGFRFVEARGNPDKISKAKKLLLYTTIGSAVVLGAWTIANILTNTINLIIS